MDYNQNEAACKLLQAACELKNREYGQYYESQ